MYSSEIRQESAKRTIVCQALTEHFGHSDWYTANTTKDNATVTLSETEETFLISDLGISSLIEKYTIILDGRQVRKERDKLLVESDSLVLPDRWSSYSSTKQSKISTYRQELRDVPQQDGFPNNVVWPVYPV